MTLADEVAHWPAGEIARRCLPLCEPAGLPAWNHDEVADLIGDPARLQPAAVLIGLRASEVGWQVLLTRRTEGLSSHAGQVSLPGGRIEAGDGGPVAAALREAQEEVGIAAADLSPLGLLPCYATVTGFLVTPVVAVRRDAHALDPDPGEVALVFEAPLALFVDPDRRRIERRPWQGRLRASYVFEYAGQRIWGATAAMLVHFADRLQD